MTTSQEYQERFDGYVPRDPPLRFDPDLPRARSVDGATRAGGQPHDPAETPPPGAPGGPPPVPPQQPAGVPDDSPATDYPDLYPDLRPPDSEPVAAGRSEFDKGLAELGDAARRGLRFQAAAMTLLAGYANLFVAVSHALSMLEPSDLDGEDDFKERLATSMMAAERALHAQQPPHQAAA